MQSNQQMNTGGVGAPSSVLQLQQQMQHMSQLQQQMMRQQQQQSAPQQQYPMNNIGCNGMLSQMNNGGGSGNAAQLPQMSQLQQEMLRQQQQVGNQKQPQGAYGNTPQNTSHPPGPNAGPNANQQWGLMFWACGDQSSGQSQGGGLGEMQEQNGTQGSGMVGNASGMNNPNFSAQSQQQTVQQQGCLNNVGGNAQQQGQSPLLWNAAGPQQTVPSLQQTAVPGQMMNSGNGMTTNINNSTANGCGPGSMMMGNLGQGPMGNLNMGDQQQSQGNCGGSNDVSQLLQQQQALIQKLQQQLQQSCGGNMESLNAFQMQQQTGMQQMPMQPRGSAMSGIQQQVPMGQQQTNNSSVSGLPGMGGIQQGSLANNEQPNMQGLLGTQNNVQSQMGGQIQGQMGTPAGMAPSLQSVNAAGVSVPAGGGAMVGNMAGAQGNLLGMAGGTGFGNGDSTQDLSENKGPNIQGKQQSFLDGSFAGGWQSNADLPDRRRIIFSIVKAIERMRPDASKMSQKVSLMAKKLEERLYRSALTKEEYVNQETLKKRLQKVLQELQQQQQQQDVPSGNEQQSSSFQAVPSGLSQQGSQGGNAMMGLLLKQQQQKQQQQLKERRAQQLAAQQGGCPNSAGTPIPPVSVSSSGAPQHVLSQETESSSVFEQLQNNWCQASKTPETDVGSLMAGSQQDMDMMSVGSEFIKSGNGNSDAIAKAHKKKVVRQQQQRLVLLRHASKCTNGPICNTKFCPQMVTLWTHMKKCRDKNCKTAHCLSSRRVLNHFRVCKAENMTSKCEICGPVMKYIQAHSAQSDGEHGVDQMEELAKEQGSVLSGGHSSAEGIGQGAGENGGMRDIDDPLMTMPLASLGGDSQGTDGNANESQLLDEKQAKERQEAQQKLQQGQLLLQQLQQQQAQLLDQQKQIQQQQQHVLPQSPQGQQLQQKHTLLQKLQQEFRQQQQLLQQELKQRSLVLQRGKGQIEQQMSSTALQGNVVGSTGNGICPDAFDSLDGNKPELMSQQGKKPNSKKHWAAPPESGPLKGKGYPGGKRLSKMTKEKSKSKLSETKASATTSKRSADALSSSGIPCEDTQQPQSKLAKVAESPSFPDKKDDKKTGPNQSNATKKVLQEGQGDIGLQLTPQFIAQKCLPIVRNLINDPSGWVFKDPVDPVALGLADYPEIVKNPMNLGLVEKRLEDGFYKELEDVNRDVRLVFNNAILYNGEDSEVGEMAKDLLGIFEKGYEALLQAWCAVTQGSFKSFNTSQ